MEQRLMRDGEWYWVHKAIIQQYTRNVGFLAIAVYHFLASMADENQTCYPSQQYVADRLGCSRSAVSKAIRKLVDGRLIIAGKRKRYNRLYQLLDLRSSHRETEMSPRGNQDTSVGNTNNNKRTRNNNDTFVRVPDSYKTNNELENGDDAEARQTLLAHDLSEALSDPEHYQIYLSFAGKYPESFLRQKLSEAKRTPEGRIKKSRAALFTYLVHHHAKR